MEFDYLDPATTVFETAPDGTLRVTVPGDRCGLRVEVMRAFPLKHPEEQIVLRDGGGEEIGVLRDLKSLPENVREQLREQLRRRYFLPRVLAILDVKERFGSSQWELETDRGRRNVTTRVMHEAIFEIEPGRFLLTDVEENRYEIPDLNALDDDSRARFLGKM